MPPQTLCTQDLQRPSHWTPSSLSSTSLPQRPHSEDCCMWSASNLSALKLQSESEMSMSSQGAPRFPSPGAPVSLTFSTNSSLYPFSISLNLAGFLEILLGRVPGDISENSHWMNLSRYVHIHNVLVRILNDWIWSARARCQLGTTQSIVIAVIKS